MESNCHNVYQKHHGDGFGLGSQDTSKVYIYLESMYVISMCVGNKGDVWFNEDPENTCTVNSNHIAPIPSPPHSNRKDVHIPPCHLRA